MVVVVVLLLGLGIDGPAEGFGNGAEEVVRDDDGAPLLLRAAALLPLLQAYPLFSNSFPRRGGDAARAARR